MNRSVLKQEAKQQLSKNLGVLILSGLILGLIINLPSMIQGYNTGLILSHLDFITDFYGKELPTIEKLPIVINLIFPYTSVLLWAWIAVEIIKPVLTLGVHHIYLKATTDEKPLLSEMFSKMPQFGTAFLTNLLVGIFVILWSLLLIIPGIIATYSYSMVYFVLAEHPEFSAMDAIKESKRIMKGHRFELFVLQLSFIWWYLLCVVTFGLAIIYVIPYTEMAKANFYNKIKQSA